MEDRPTFSTTDCRSIQDAIQNGSQKWKLRKNKPLSRENPTRAQLQDDSDVESATLKSRPALWLCSVREENVLLMNVPTDSRETAENRNLGKSQVEILDLKNKITSIRMEWKAQQQDADDRGTEVTWKTDG